MKYIFLSLFIFLGFFSEVHASDMTDIFDATSRIEERTLVGDTQAIANDIENIQQKITRFPEGSIERNDFEKELASMRVFLDNPNNASTTLTDFLLANNELYGNALTHMYVEEDERIPANVYQLQYLATKLHYEVLGGDWRSIERRTAEDIYTWWADTRPLLVDGTFKNNIEVTKNEMRFAVEAQDADKTFSIASRFKDVIPELTETLQKTEEFRTRINYAMYGGVAVGLILLGFVFIFGRKFIHKRL